MVAPLVVIEAMCEFESHPPLLSAADDCPKGPTAPCNDYCVCTTIDMLGKMIERKKLMHGVELQGGYIVVTEDYFGPGRKTVVRRRDGRT